MLEGLKRLFTAAPAPAPTDERDLSAIQAWAERKGHVLRGVRESEGFVVEGKVGAVPWRLEWGPSQRPYVKGFELRLRAELGLPPDVQVLVLNRELQEQMEKDVFDQYVEGVQTRIDNQTPPEMRWLVMFPKLSGPELGSMRERFAALASHKAWLAAWLTGPLRTALAGTSLPAGQPLVLMVGRGRLTLRKALEEPEVRGIEPWVALFETAMREARRVHDEGGGNAVPSTQPSLWHAGEAPGGAAPKED
jgi:hypothetical protein